MKKIIILVFLISIGTNATAQIKWMSLESASLKAKKNPKKIMVDVYTDWCHWCKVMDRKTFNNDKVVLYINENFYAVKLDAESKKSIQIDNQIFRFDTNTGMNQAAQMLLNNQMSFPSVVFMDEKFKVISPVAGFRNAKEFLNISKYFNENQYLSQSFLQFSKGKKK